MHGIHHEHTHCCTAGGACMPGSELHHTHQRIVRPVRPSARTLLFSAAFFPLAMRRRPPLRRPQPMSGRGDVPHPWQWAHAWASPRECRSCRHATVAGCAQAPNREDAALSPGRQRCRRRARKKQGVRGQRGAPRTIATTFAGGAGVSSQRPWLALSGSCCNKTCWR